MKKLLLSVAILALAIATGLFFYFSDPNIIDEDYISSQKYRTLENEIEKDRADNRSREWILERIALHISDSSTKYERPLPLRLDSTAIDLIISLNDEIAPDNIELQDEFSNNYSYTGILVLSEDNFKSIFFLRRSKGLYKDINIILATVADSSLIDFESIGSFGKNLTEKTESTIQIEDSTLIKTTVVKERFYPVRQKNEVEYYYKILADGTIQAKINQDR